VHFAAVLNTEFSLSLWNFTVQSRHYKAYKNSTKIIQNVTVRPRRRSHHRSPEYATG